MNLTKIDRQILDSYASMIEGLSMYLGSVYEISLHSLEDYDHSVVKIMNGYHSGRTVGAPLTDLALNMLKRIKDINEALPGMLLIECIYLVVAQIIIFIAVPNKIMCAVGLLAGCLYAVFSSFHLSFTIRKVVYGGHKQSSTLVFGYIVRFLVMIILLALLYIFKAGDLLCAIIGMFSEKIAAYLSPLLDKKRSAKGENSTGEFPQTDKNIIEKESE